jgi:hypothetical protein
MLLFLVACTAPRESDTIADPPADTANDVGDTEYRPPFDDDTATPEAVTSVASMQGRMHWHVDFDADAEAAGYVDCDYERTYTNGTEFRHSPWVCPQCDVMLRLDDEMTAGHDDCYVKISNNDPPTTEVLGWGGDRFYRTYFDNYQLSDQGSATFEGPSLATHSETPFDFQNADGVVFHAAFTVDGAFEVGTTDADPMRGLYPPDSYQCGWPKADPAAWSGDFVVRQGEVLPDAAFRDVCSDALRLHDLAGRWLVLDMSAIDCGPCQAMASQAPGFEERLSADGIDVMTVTFLGPSLDDPLKTSTREQLYSWGVAFGPDHDPAHDPVLADRGYGWYVLGQGAGTIVGADPAFPSWLVVDPDLRVVGGGVGFSTFDDIEAIIRSP